MSPHLWGALITAFGGMLLTGCGFGWFTPGGVESISRGWRTGMKIIGPLMLIEAVIRILIASPA